MQDLMGPVFTKGNFKSTKCIYVPSYSPVHGEFENTCFVSVALTVGVSCAFVYIAVGIKKIAAHSLPKLGPYNYPQSTTGLKL